MKNMMSMANSITAVMEPTCMAWAPTRSMPSQKMSDSTAFMRKKVIVSVVAKSRLTRMARAA